MKLMIEAVDYDSIEYVKEDIDGEKKNWKIKGPFLQAETKNRNGRIYSSDLIEREVNKYMKERVATNSNGRTRSSTNTAN